VTGGQLLTMGGQLVECPKRPREGGAAPMEVALQWTDETGEFIRSYVNGVRTPSGGTWQWA